MELYLCDTLQYISAKHVKSTYRMAGAFYIVKNSGDIANNTLTSLSAVCYFHLNHDCDVIQ